MIRLFFGIILLVSNTTLAQVPFAFPVSTIPDSLREQAVGVYRINETHLDIFSTSKYVHRTHQVITVFDSDARDLIKPVFEFNKFVSIDDIDVSYYNANGLLIRRLTKRDFNVVSAYDGMSLVTDDKVMYADLPNVPFPCTMDLSFTVIVNSYINLPRKLITENGVSTERFEFKVSVPKGQRIRYRSCNIDLSPTISTEKSDTIYNWRASNVKGFRIEKGTYKGDHFLPRIDVSPAKFQYDGYNGEAKDWKSLGAFFYPFYEESAPFKENRALEIRAISDSQSTLVGKVAALYRYMQQSVRYVSIQLGIGGIKPFSVSDVDTKKYGDCKALSNYMRYLLAEAGIKSYPALINAGYNLVPADPSWPADVFNHVILCIPNSKDTLWLECTSNHAEPGFLGSFTANKQALVLTEQGGVLVRTPFNKSVDNRLKLVTNIKLATDGSANVSFHSAATGDFFGSLKQVVRDAKDVDEMKQDFSSQFGLRLGTNVVVNNVADSLGWHSVKMSSFYDKAFDFKAGSKFFITPGFIKLHDDKLPVYSDRKSPFLFRFPFVKESIVRYELPVNVQVESYPAAFIIRNDCFEFERKVAFNKQLGVIEWNVRFVLHQPVVSQDKYELVARSLAQVEKEESQKLILKFE